MMQNKGEISVGCRLKSKNSNLRNLITLQGYKVNVIQRIGQNSYFFLMKLQRVWACCTREGKNCLVMNVVSAMVLKTGAVKEPE